MLFYWCRVGFFTALACFVGGTAFAAPNGYSINSDSDNDLTRDSLYLIDLATGSETRIGSVRAFNQFRSDVEGLAIAPDGTLYGVDEDFLTLFPINKATGAVITAQEVFIDGVPTGGGNDFGMTFGCDGNLYITSVTTQTLYRMQLDGVATPVGGLGNLGVGISAIAAYGNPVQLFGLSNGDQNQDPASIRKLWSLDIQTGAATEVGTIGSEALKYDQAGLAFDEDGELWALTDRRDQIGFPVPSQILRLDGSNGRASAITSTSQNGYESLAISPPRGCFGGGNGETARFAVSKRFMDSNNQQPVTFDLSCNTGLPLEQSISVEPSGGLNQDLEVTFVVTDFESGELDCQLSEQAPAGYQGTYDCDGESACSAGDPSALDDNFQGPCSFTDVETGDENVCFIRNYIAPVDVDVTKLWIDVNEEFEGPTIAEMSWACVNARSSGDDLTIGTETGDLQFFLQEETVPFSVYPNFDPAQPTVCSVTEDFPGFDSDVESDASECQGLMVSPGTGAACTVINTRLYAGIPTLDTFGKSLLVLIMLSLGLFNIRRIL